MRKPPSSEKIGKTGAGTATEGIFKEIGALLLRVPTWTLSTNRTQEAEAMYGHLNSKFAMIKGFWVQFLQMSKLEFKLNMTVVRENPVLPLGTNPFN